MFSIHGVRQRCLALAVAASAALAVVPASALRVQAATSHNAAATDEPRPVVSPAGGFTRSSFSLVGDWAIDYTFDRHLGTPTTAIPPRSYLVRFQTWPTKSFLGNDPVYFANWFEFATDDSGKRCIRVTPGAFFASPFVGQRGINLTANNAGNTEDGDFTFAYAGTYALRSTNTPGVPLEFTGVWNDIDANGGRATLKPVVAPPVCGGPR